MSGYLFTFTDEASLFESINCGSYSTLMNPKWNDTVASTLGDYVTMRPGDSVYFFSKRTVYGIGEIVEVVPEVAAAENYAGASLKPKVEYAFISLNSIVDDPIVTTDSGERVKRWVITFKPSPHFFSTGIDMDDLLMSNPKAFRSLRVFEKRSFIKLDEEENQAFKAALLRRNIQALYNPSKSNTVECCYEKTLETYRERIGNRSVNLDIPGLLAESRKRNGSLTSEMLLEVGLLYQLSTHDTETEAVFGKWDYLSHQVAASPMKPVQWVDRIDVFALRYIIGNAPIVECYGIVELKKDTVTGDDIQQVMKYVDWVNQEYGTGDYSLITAFLVGRDFDMESITRLDETAERRYTIGRPARPESWHNLTYVTYGVDEAGHIAFEKIQLEEPCEAVEEPFFSETESLSLFG